MVSIEGELEITPPTLEKCPNCQTRVGDAGAGWLMVDGKMQRCDCNAARASRKDETMAILAGAIGQYAGRTLDSFLVQSISATLHPVKWGGGGINEDGEKVQDVEYSPAEQSLYLHEALGAVRRWVAKPDHWLFFQGPRGSGKTHLITAAGWELASQGYLVRYAVVPRMLDWIKAGMDELGESADERVRQMETAQIAIFDDIGVERGTDWELREMFRIIEHRDTNGLPTLFASNTPIRRLEDRVRDRILGRLPNKRVTPVIASSFRTKRDAA